MLPMPSAQTNRRLPLSNYAKVYAECQCPTILDQSGEDSVQPLARSLIAESWTCPCSPHYALGRANSRTSLLLGRRYYARVAVHVIISPWLHIPLD